MNRDRPLKRYRKGLLRFHYKNAHTTGATKLASVTSFSAKKEENNQHS
jgi:hypothetical protein